MLPAMHMSSDPELAQQDRNPVLLGCIADDLTGATDLAGVLVLNGIRTIVEFGIPASPASRSDAIVIALKSRSAQTKDAVDSSVAALRWLRDQGCRRFLFKYCSTFDSTPAGNIGPVAEALMDELDAEFTIACPAFPANRRTVYNGYLFVNGVLLEETSMRVHPLNPMSDSNLVRLLQSQCKRKVGLIGYEAVREGSAAIANSIREARARGVGIAIVDAISEFDLQQVALACQDLPFWTGASGLAIGAADVCRRQGLLDSRAQSDELPRVAGFSAILSGSCSHATQLQVAWMETRAPTLRLDPLALASDTASVDMAIEWARARMSEGPILISATASEGDVKTIQAKLGARAGQFIEQGMARIARGLVGAGVRRLIVAGGETSGAVVAALGITRLRIGPVIDPGVHWGLSEGEPRLALALKSGNFGSEDFFEKAWGLLP
jgi:uncharacterized protein YgbK (DUF1537 family)